MIPQMRPLPRPALARPLTGSGAIAPEGLPVSQGGAGEMLTDLSPRGFWARITAHGDGNAYGYERCDDAQPLDFPAAEFETLHGGQKPWSSDGTSAPAYEVNGATDVPTDGSVVAWLEPLLAVPGYGFSYTAAGGGSGPEYGSVGVVIPNYTMTAAAGTLEDASTGFQFPAAGTYLCWMQVWAQAYMTALPVNGTGTISAMFGARLGGGLVGVVTLGEWAVLNVQVVNRYCNGSATLVGRIVVADPATVYTVLVRRNATAADWLANLIYAVNEGSGASIEMPYLKVA